jgi:SPP1 family phage portal protein
MTSKELQEIFSKVEMRLPRIQTNEAYVEGRNPYILNKEVGKKPDNRIPVPLAKMAVEDMAGYAGRSGDIVTDYELVEPTETEAEKDDDFIKYMRAMDVYNKEPIETSELYEESLIQGESYEIWWTSEQFDFPSKLLTAEYKIVPSGSVFLKYTDDIKKVLEFAVYFTGDKEDKRADVYFPLKREVWNRNKAGTWVKEPNDIEHPYTTVPVNVFMSNRRATPLFEAEKPLIDSFDELISKSINEVDRFNALMLLLGSKADVDFVRKYTEGKISVIDEIEDDESSNLPRYLEKNLGGVNEFYNDLTDRVEELFHKSVKIPDMSDESFAGNASGVAIAFKLIGMEFKASQIETYFNQGLVRRLSFYADIFSATKAESASIDVGDYKATVKASRNIPMDMKAKAEIAQILLPIVSKETLLKFLPKSIVEDVEKELEKLKAQQPTDLLGITNTETQVEE